MTIDESIENLVLLKKLEDGLGNISGNTNSVASQSLDKAIDTMRRYQKIKHIINDVPYLDKDEYKVASIKEIIDGNDDC